MNNLCPKCHRPFNEGNSPNSEECNGTDDEEGLCKAYAKIWILKAGLDKIHITAHCIAKSGPAITKTLADVWPVLNQIAVMATTAIHDAK